MAITASLLTAEGSGANANSYVTASITPGANRLVLAAVLNTRGNTPSAATLSGNGLTWVEVASVTWGTIASPSRRLSVFRAMGAAPSAGAVTITLSGVTHTGCSWVIAECSGVDTGGTHGSAAVVQSASANADGASALSVTLAAFGGAGNAAYGTWSVEEVLGTVDPEAGYIELGETSQTGPAVRLNAQWLDGADTSPSASWTDGTRNCGALALELKASAVEAKAMPPFRRPWRVFQRRG